MNQQNQEQNEKRNFLIEFEEKGLDLRQFKPYEEFLFDCSRKDYFGVGTHEHHILPKGFMEGSDKKQNLITLSYQDHYKSHLILAECFHKGDKRRGYNYGASKLIVGWVKRYLSKRYDDISEHWEGFWELAHKEVCELTRGENHPQYGDKYSPEKCKEMSDRMKGKYVGELNHFFGRKHSEETKNIIREKRLLQVFSDESNKKKSETMTGEGNHFFGKNHSQETKKLISEKIKEYYMNNPKPKPEIELPEGLFRCNKINDAGKICNIMRHCPDCKCELFYTIKETPSYLNGLVSKNPKCKKCATKNRPVEQLSNRIIVRDTVNHITYNSQTDAMRHLNIRFAKFKQLINNGIFEIIENKSSWNVRKSNETQKSIN